MALFIRSVVLGVVFSVTGLSSALVICVTGCADAPGAKLALERSTPGCHDSPQAEGPTIGNGPVACAHEPRSLIAGALAFDMRPTLAASPSIANVSPTLHVIPSEWTTPLTVSRTLLAQRPSTTLRI